MYTDADNASFESVVSFEAKQEKTISYANCLI